MTKRAVSPVDQNQFLELLDRSGKRRRIDEDFKRHVAVDMFHDGAVRYSRQALKNWVAVESALAARSKMTCAGVTAVSEDASRQGKPDGETSIFLLWDGDLNAATVAAPQVVIAREAP